MDDNLLHILSSAFRMIFISANCQGVMLVVLNATLGKKRSMKYVILYYAIKIVLINTILGMVMKDIYRDIYLSTEWLRILYVVGVSTAAVMNFIMLSYTFRGEPLRIAMVSLIGEMMSAFFGYTSIGIINVLEGRELFSYMGAFRLLDFGIPVICYSLVGIFYYFCRPFLKKLKLYEFKHKKLLWLLFITFILSGTYTLLWEHRKNVRSGMLMILLLMGIWIPILSIALGKYRKKLEDEHDFLETQQGLMKAHYQNVLEEVHRLEHSRKETEEQMAEIRSIQCKTCRKNWISDYKESLAWEYQKLNIGLYCDDWVLDAALSSQAELLEQHGIRLECSL